MVDPSVGLPSRTPACTVVRFVNYVINLLFWSCFFVFFYSSEYYRPHSPCSVFFYSFLKNGVTHTSTN